MQKRKYFENLDGLRFLAALAVMGDHITRSFYFSDTWLKKVFIIVLSTDGLVKCGDPLQSGADAVGNSARAKIVFTCRI